MLVDSRFYVEQVAKNAVQTPDACSVKVTLKAAFGSYLAGLPEGNGDWSKWTPSGEITMSITNPQAADAFEPGAVYSVKFEKVSP